MYTRTGVAALALACVVAGGRGYANQAGAPPAVTPAPAMAMPPVTGAPPASAPSPEALALGHTLAMKSGGSGMMAMNGLSMPLAKLMKQLHVRPDQSQFIMSQAIIPVLLNHTNEMTDIQARSYASVLSEDTMKAAIAFFESPPGRELVAARATTLRMNADALVKLFDQIMPEFQARMDQIAKAGGGPK